MSEMALIILSILQHIKKKIRKKEEEERKINVDITSAAAAPAGGKKKTINEGRDGGQLASVVYKTE